MRKIAILPLFFAIIAEIFTTIMLFNLKTQRNQKMTKLGAKLLTLTIKNPHKRTFVDKFFARFHKRLRIKSSKLLES